MKIMSINSLSDWFLSDELDTHKLPNPITFGNAI